MLNVATEVGKVDPVDGRMYMVKRELLLTSVAALLLAVAFVVGRQTAGGDGPWLEAPSLESGAEVRSEKKSVEMGSSRASTSECVSEQSEIDRLQSLMAELLREQSFQVDMYEKLEREAYGDPVPWPDSAPEEMRPGMVEEIVEETFAECDIGLPLGTIDCSEPPCIVAVQGSSADFRDRVMGCPAWNGVYGRYLENNMITKACGDGSGDRTYSDVIIMRLSWSAYWDDSGADELENKKRRIKYREAEMGRDWACN